MTALTDDALAAIRGTGQPLAGTDQISSAENAQSISIGFQLFVSNQNRDLVDNWTSEVAVPLIAAATNAAH